MNGMYARLICGSNTLCLKKFTNNYNFSVKKGFELLDFEKALELEEQRIKRANENILSDKNHNYAFYRLGYRSRGIYCDNVANWIKSIPKKTVLNLGGSHFFLYELIHVRV